MIPLLIFSSNLCVAQQNLTFYFQHSVPHTNFLNPAVQSSCKWYMGIPVLSSTHINYGNSSGSVRDFMQFGELDQDKFIRNLPNRAHVNTEFQLNLISFGFASKGAFWSFAITDKLDIAVFAPKPLIEIILKGNSPYEGRAADLSGLSVFSSYYREYSAGWAKKISNEMYIGFHGKLLFGKANVVTRKSGNSLFTEPTTFDLDLQSTFKFNTSLPFTYDISPEGALQGATFNSSVPEVLLNRKNIGLAVDAGFINKSSEDITWAGSVLDLGVVYWRDNPYNYSHSGMFRYDGPLGDTLVDEDYADRLYNDAISNFNVNWTNKSYLSFLAPRFYLGFQKNLSRVFSWSLTGTAKLYRYKVIPGLSAGLDANISKSIVCTASFSYLNRSFKNVGLGLVLGNNPFQFYVITDNVFGLIYPLRYRTINLRTGFILKFGCNRKSKIDNCGCEWLRQSEERELRKQRLLHQ